MLNRFCLLLIVVWSSSFMISAQEVISIEKFGLKPDTRENATPFVKKAMAYCKTKKGVTLRFPKGRYDFWPAHCIERDYFESNTTDNNPKRLAILIDEMADFTLDGDHSMFVIHDRMQPVTVENSTDIRLKNFSVDWDIPLTAEGRVVASTASGFDVEIDRYQFPYMIENNRLFFVGEGWKSPMFAWMEFRPDSRIVEPYTGDRGWGGYRAEELRPGVVRFSHEKGQSKYPKAGNYLVLRHSARDHAGMFLLNSRGVVMEDIHLYHTCGLGILSQYSSDLSFSRVEVVPNPVKKRYLSGHDDGFHFMGCSGSIKIEDCRWQGLMDDPINIHGTCARIIRTEAPDRLIARFMHHQSTGMEWGRVGEKVGFIDNANLHTIGTGTIKSFRPLNRDEFEIVFNEPFPADLKEGEAIENLTCTADVEIRRCRFQSCRARGLLISTPGKVIIEDNDFESSGSAILIAGDANQWYESGAVKDVLIRRNTFRSACLTSLYQFCEAVISIFPEIPHPDSAYPFHSNIRIEENTFYLFDYPILYARSVDGLTFSRNQLVRSYDSQPFHYNKMGITLEACRNVRIEQNKVEGEVLGREVRLKDTRRRDLLLRHDSFFEIEKKKAVRQ